MPNQKKRTSTLPIKKNVTHKRNHNQYLKKTLRHSRIKKLLDKQKNTSGCLSNLLPFEAEFEKLIQHRKGNKPFQIQKEMQRILRKKTVPKKILPNNDFYTFINYEWMKNATNLDDSVLDEKYIVQYDDFRIVQNKVYYELIDIVKDYIQRHHTEQATQIRHVYQAGLKMLNDEQARKHVKRFVNFLDVCRSKQTVAAAWSFLGTMNKNEIISGGLPFVMSLNPDEQEPTVARIYMNQPQQTLVDYNVYIDDGTDVAYKARYRRKYMEFIDKLFQHFYGFHHGFNPKDVFDCEVEMMDAIVCEVKTDKPYVRVHAEEALSKYGFDWKTMSHAFGFDKPPSFFVVNNINYLTCGTAMFLKGWDTEKWRTYYIYLYMRQVARFHKAWRVTVFDFYGKFMRGQEYIFPANLECVFNLAFSFNTFLTNQYIDKFANPAAIDYLQTMAEDLRLVYKRIIQRNTWLQPETKRYALLKLDHFDFEVGSPKLLRHDPFLSYVNNDVWINFGKINRWRSLSLVHLEGKSNVDIPVIDWLEYPFKITGTQAYVVNAFYTPTQNKIYIPAAYIQKPFVDLEDRGIEYNLSTIGFTLGHEMSHALDDSGSQYDHTGKLHNWWKKQDATIFDRKQKDVIKQYEEFAKRDGIHFDASISIGEDLADISGLAICLEYLKDFLEKNKAVIPIRVLSFKAFLIYFAFQFKQKISKKAIQAQIRTNPHPLDKYRTNVPLSRVEIFRDMYTVKQGDGMWWHNTDLIW